MNVLSLCAGVGGLDLGVELATGGDARTVCFVEREAHAAAVLVSRMEEALLAPAAVWSDLTTFDGREWRGVVDLVVAGYPCQPFSTAGKRAGVDDPRHLWPHVARIIRECGAGLVLLENVPGHLSLGFDAVCGDLQGMGYRVAAGVFSAAEVGSSHRRERLFILAYCDKRECDEPELTARNRNAHGNGDDMAHPDGGQREQRRWSGKDEGGAERRVSGPDGCDAGVAQSLCGGLGRQAEVGPPSRTGLHEAHPGTEHHGAGNRPMEDSDGERGCCGKAGCEDAAANQAASGVVGNAEMDDADRAGRREGDEEDQVGPSEQSDSGDVVMGDPSCEGLQGGLQRSGDDTAGWEVSLGRPSADGIPAWPPGPLDSWDGIPKRCWPATAKPGVHGMADGMASWVDRLRACGNGVVPLAAAHAFRTLTAALAGCVEEER